MKKDSGISKRTSSLDKATASAELEKFKKMAATVDLVNRPAKAKEETTVELKDEPDDDDDGDQDDDVGIQFESDSTTHQ